MIDAGTAWKLQQEEFQITDRELYDMPRYEIDMLEEMVKPSRFHPFKIEAWRQRDPELTILRITYPTPDITSLERYDYEPDHGEPMDRASRAAESYRAANTPAPEARFLRWL